MKTIYSPFRFMNNSLLVCNRCKAIFLLMSISFANYSFAQKRINNAVSKPKFSYNYTYKIIGSANNTYGYDVYVNNVLRIHQPFIPAMPGNRGFANKEAAEKIVQLVIGKMKKGETLPAVSREEMKKLKAL